MISRSLRLLSLPALALLVALGLSSCDTAPVVMRPGGFSTVVIDAGHGGKDSGERSHGIAEKDVTLDTAERLRPLLQHAGFRTVMVRSDDNFVELDDRVRLANRYPNGILVSIHYNASPSSSPSGIETYFWRADSYGLATRVARHLVEETSLDYRGVKRRVLRLTHNSQIPSILCECGFLTNAGEANQVRNGEFRQQVAEGITAGIVEQHDQGDVGLGLLPRMTVESSRRGRSRHRHISGSSSSRHGRSSASRRHSSSGRHHTSSSSHHRRHRN